MRLSVRLNFALIAGITLVSLAVASYQTQSETRGLKRDLERHATELADSLEKSAEPLVLNHSFQELQGLVNRFQNHERIGVAVYNPEGQPLAVSSDLEARLANSPGVAQEGWRVSGGEFFKAGESLIHVFELPIRAGTTIIGGLAIFHDASYIDARRAALWRTRFDRHCRPDAFDRLRDAADPAMEPAPSSRPPDALAARSAHGIRLRHSGVSRGRSVPTAASAK